MSVNWFTLTIRGPVGTTESHDSAQLNYVCVQTSSMSRHCEGDLLACTNPDLSFDDMSQQFVVVVADWPPIKNRW